MIWYEWCQSDESQFCPRLCSGFPAGAAGFLAGAAGFLAGAAGFLAGSAQMGA
jgi:hypothetical protein